MTFYYFSYYDPMAILCDWLVQRICIIGCELHIWNQNHNSKGAILLEVSFSSAPVVFNHEHWRMFCIVNMITRSYLEYGYYSKQVISLLLDRFFLSMVGFNNRTLSNHSKWRIKMYGSCVIVSICMREQKLCRVAYMAHKTRNQP